jgi:RecJ-like exonuclease
MPEQSESCPLCRGAGFVTYRDGIAYETHDVEREEHLIEDCPECSGSGKVSVSNGVRAS